jgi:hypothetical protein
MQNQDSQDPAADPSNRSASQSPPNDLATPGRRRTQEQGQGDLDDDREEPAFVEEAARQGCGIAQ